MFILILPESAAPDLAKRLAISNHEVRYTDRAKGAHGTLASLPVAVAIYILVSLLSVVPNPRNILHE